MALELNIQVKGVKVEQQAPINVFYKVFTPNGEGKNVPTLIRNTTTETARHQFVRKLAETKQMLIDLSGNIGENTWRKLCPQNTLTFDTNNPDELQKQVVEVVRQTMTAIAKDEQRDLYEAISIDLICCTNHEENQQGNEQDLPF